MRRIANVHFVSACVVCVTAMGSFVALADAPCTGNEKHMRSLAALLQANYAALVPGGQFAFKVGPDPGAPLFKKLVVRHLHNGKDAFAVETSGISGIEIKALPLPKGEGRGFALRIVD